MVLQYLGKAKQLLDAARRNKQTAETAKKSFGKGYEMIKVKGKSTPEGRAKVEMMKSTNQAVKRGKEMIEEGEEAIKKAKTPGQYFMDTGEEARTSKRTVKVAKQLRDAKRSQRKMEDVQQRVYDLETPMEFETYKHGGSVKKSCQIKGWGKARRR